MLEELLHWISLGGMHPVSELARRLGVSQALVEAMLADLVRAGYLHQVDGCSEGRCPGCASNETCRTGKTRMWVPAEKFPI